MKTRLLLTMAAAALVLASCDNDENETDEVQNSEIRLSSGVAVQTRVFGIDQQISDGRTVVVYVDKITENSPLYAKNVLRADGKGGFTDGEVMYFPDDKEKVSIYALATNAPLTTDFPAGVTHTVSDDQTKIADYATSDLLYAAKKGVALTKDAVALTFYHMLSKVEVALKVGGGAPDLADAEVFIVGTKLKAGFTPGKAADVTTQPARDAMIAETAASNDVADIKVGNQITTDEDWAANAFAYNEAVIVPQAVAQDAQFIKVKLDAGGELYHKLEAATTFKSGKKYSYQITVNLTELNVASTIADWEPVGEPVEGDAEME